MKSPADDAIDRMLSASDEPLHDRGFTSAVLMQLPPRKARKRTRASILLGFAAAAGLIPTGVYLSSPDALATATWGLAAAAVAITLLWSELMVGESA